MKGKVKFFDEKKGYGFITGEDGKDAFCHYSHIKSEGFKTLADGDAVQYDVESTPKGLAARNIVKV